jgi:hypothetical protein
MWMWAVVVMHPASSHQEQASKNGREDLKTRWHHGAMVTIIVSLP